ncbi:MAG: LysR family transcriptional regulator [Rhodovarius sp.]|nr:LysR family transcriptional regulator [Rhodovarius sp.]
MTESFRDLRLFVAAYEERSFTAAAERENATQSGVSQHIRKLEDRYGCRLFLRGKGAVVPTPAGEALYRRALALLRGQEEAVRAMRALAGSLEGEVQVGLMPTLTRCALAPTIDRFLRQHPNVLLRVTEAYSAALVARVRAAELDFAIVPAFPGDVGVRLRPFLRTPEVLVTRAGSGLAHLAPVRLAELPPLSLVLPGAANTRRQTIETYLASQEVRIERVLELDAMLGTLDLVATTGWSAILPGVMMAADAARREGQLFTVNPLADPPLPLDLVLVSPARRSLSAPALAFLSVLEEETARLNAIWQGALPGG